MTARVASAIEYQFTPIPTEALERLAGRRDLTARQLRIIFVVWRKTWGWSKEKDKIPMSQFAHLTGIDRRKCHVILTELINMKIIKKSVAANGHKKTITYSFNDVFLEWKMLPPTVTGKKRKTVPLDGNGVLPPTVTKVLPPTAHSIEINRNITKESAAALPGPLRGVREHGAENQTERMTAEEAFKQIRSIFAIKNICSGQTPSEREERQEELHRQADALRGEATVDDSQGPFHA